jgi:tRNA (uracil-5-)-methyltransferase
VQGAHEFAKDFEILKDLQKEFPGEDLGIEAIIKENKRAFFFLKFTDSLAKEKFLKKGAFKLRNRNMKIREAKISRDTLKKERTIEELKSFAQKRQENTRKEIEEAKAEDLNRPPMTKEELTQSLRQRICVFGDLPYAEQIQKKREILEGYLKEIKTIAKGRLQPHEVQSMKWLSQEGDLCCELQDFVQCDEDGRKYYRTKTEFSVGVSSLDQQPKVGFNVPAAHRRGFSIELCDTPEETLTLPVESFLSAQIAEDLIRTLKWPIFDRSTITGFWRFIVVRVSKITKQMLINIVGNKKYFAAESFDTDFRQQFIVPFIAKLTSHEIMKGYKVMGVTFQHTDTSSDSIPYVEDSELELVHGQQKTYEEKIAGCVFEVSNSSFLQINIKQTEKMYTWAQKYAGLDSKTVLLDICSGIGTIGITAGQVCHKVVGIEMVKSACANAVKNAARNGMAEKYEVVEGKVEDKMEGVASQYSGQGWRIVGIIDPPRAGIHPDVIRCLRTCRGLDELVFICCDVKQSKTNIIDLCLPQNKKRRGPPFSPILCTGFDMFPHTNHFETMFVLKRLYEELGGVPVPKSDS